MTDLGVPSDERTEAVSRVLAAISSGTNDGALELGTLREALESEGHSLMDLPEVGLWLALTQISLTGSDADTPIDLTDTRVIDLRGALPAFVEPDVPDPPAPASAAESVTESAPAVESSSPPAAEVERPTAAEPPAPTRRHRGRRLSRRRRVDPIVVEQGQLPPGPDLWVPDPGLAEPAPALAEPARPEPPPPETELDALQAFLARALATGPLRIPLGDGCTSGGASILPSDHIPKWALLAIASVSDHVELALTPPLSLRLPDPAAPGSAGVAVHWRPALVRSLAALADHIETVLSSPLVLDLPDPTEPHDAVVDVHWHQPVVRTIDALEAFLCSLQSIPSRVRVPASRLAGATNGAAPDPYWPRHLIRSGAVDDQSRAPRSPDQLEADLHDALDDVALVGEADLERSAAEMEISLALLVRRVPLDRLGRIYPATLAAFLVRQTELHPRPAEFDASVPISALRRTNAVGLAFSEALIRLSKPVFREVEQRDEFDHRVRYLRRMQLHAGIPTSQLTAVLAAVDASFWAGASSGREVAQDWLAASSSVTAAIGATTMRLLTRTDHGALMLEALLDLVRWRSLDPMPVAPPSNMEPLPPRLVDQAWATLQQVPRPEVTWGDSPRPLVRLGQTVGGGPEVELPPSSARWHLNGELLTYGSPTHRKRVALPTSRSGKWAVTVGAARRTSPFDIGIQSAATDRIVLVFDEQDRYHHHALALGGTMASVVAPAGSRVTGERDRTLLVGRWIGFECVEVDLTGLDEITVTRRGHDTVTIGLDPHVDARVLGGNRDQPRPLLVFRGHVPAPMTVEVIVEAGPTRLTSLLTDVSIEPDRGGFGLGTLLDGASQPVTSLTVHRVGFEPSTHVLATQRAAPRPRPTERADLTIVWASLTSVDALGVDELDDLWLVDPVRAASIDRWSVNALDRVALDRWTLHAGWTPPLDADDAPVALRRLVRPVLEALDADPTDAESPDAPLPAGEDGPWLSTAGWTAAITADADALADWEQRHRRPVLRWRAARPALRNLDPLWSTPQRGARSGPVLPVLATSLLAFTDGPHRAMAAERLTEAITVAPDLTIATTILALAYAHVQRTHPESRFRTIELRRR